VEKTDDFGVSVDGRPYDSPNCGVHAGCVTAASYESNSLHVPVHYAQKRAYYSRDQGSAYTTRWTIYAALRHD
jgi:hypothetical protein